MSPSARRSAQKVRGSRSQRMCQACGSLSALLRVPIRAKASVVGEDCIKVAGATGGNWSATDAAGAEKAAGRGGSFSAIVRTLGFVGLIAKVLSRSLLKLAIFCSTSRRNGRAEGLVNAKARWACPLLRNFLSSTPAHSRPYPSRQRVRVYGECHGPAQEGRSQNRESNCRRP